MNLARTTTRATTRTLVPALARRCAMNLWVRIWAWMQDHAWPEFYDFWDDDDSEDD